MCSLSSATILWSLLIAASSAQQQSNGTASSGSDVVNSPAPVNNTGFRRPVIAVLALNAPLPSGPSPSKSCLATERPNPASEVSITFWDRFTNNTCYSLAEILQPSADETYTLPDTVPNAGSRYTCEHNNPKQPNCTNDYTATRLENFDPQANYTRVNLNPINGFDFWDFSIQVFAGGDCEDDDQERPWYSWNGCREWDYDNSCEDLPYGVRSFRLLQQSSSPGQVDCLYAAERGAGVRSAESKFAAVVAGVIVVAACVLFR
ncbi:unnamed protein product [Zymoseptoria tritici ST99CH_1A5]|uniref:Ig-like domain-containing protein n=1 Tax=Zymoseptoria tritici ST99CH_1A5 TaxID=1276529 RepID=A0A1Y6LPV2_ZYMTR|nr:unnamed protein product [Zymoseptoria tritici ST99CH_1A5]